MEGGEGAASRGGGDGGTRAPGPRSISEAITHDNALLNSRRTGEQANRQTGGQADRQADRRADRRADRQAGRQAGGQAGRRASGRAGGQAGRKAGRQTEGQTGRRALFQGGIGGYGSDIHNTVFFPRPMLSSVIFVMLGTLAEC